MLQAPPSMTRFLEKLVLPERFERSTSPLPRECSTPELRQQRASAMDNLSLSARRRDHATSLNPDASGFGGWTKMSWLRTLPALQSDQLSE